MLNLCCQHKPKNNEKAEMSSMTEVNSELSYSWQMTDTQLQQSKREDLR